MYKIAVYNEKGGVGKTTIAVNLAATLAKLNYKTLLIDLDSQADATSFFNINDTIKEQCSISNAILNNKDIEDLVYKIEDHLYILSNTEFEEINLDLNTKRQSYLTSLLSKLENEFDFCIIDCSPTSCTVNNRVLEYVQEILLVSNAEYFSAKAITNVYKHMQNKLSKDKINVIVLNKVKKNKEHKEITSLIKEVFNKKEIVIIKDKISIANASRTQKIFYDIKDNELQKEFNKIIKEIIGKWMLCKI